MLARAATRLRCRSPGSTGGSLALLVVLRRLAHHLLGIRRPAEREGVDRDLLGDGVRRDSGKTLERDPDGWRESIVVEGVPVGGVARRILLVGVPVLEAHATKPVEEDGGARTGAIHPALA